MMLLLRRAASTATTFHPNTIAAAVVVARRWGQPQPQRPIVATVCATTTTTTALRSLSSCMPLPPSSNHRHVPMTHAQGTVIYTETDEAPALATYSLYPVVSKVKRGDD
jgi:hypothetical protein